ncbi:MAG: hypothetical protein RLZZ312_988 [Bacteroidota bacterium]|jgi:Uma2 family endonuclease
MGKAELKYISAEEYLYYERKAETKHEYFQGEIFAMSGASFVHNRIFSNTLADVVTKLKGKKCNAFGSDLRIHIPKNTLYTYPDITVICGKIENTDDSFDTAKNPTVIFEILSKSTRNYDKGQKFTLYRDIETLKEYILIDSEKLSIEKFSKNNDNSWTLTEFQALSDIFHIKAIAIDLALIDIYDGVDFEETKIV